MVSDRLTKFHDDLRVQPLPWAHARGLPHRHVRNFAGHSLLGAVRRDGRRLRIGRRAIRDLGNLPVSRHRNGPPLLDGRAVSWLRSVASTSGPVDARYTKISRHLAAGNCRLADLRALEHSG